MEPGAVGQDSRWRTICFARLLAGCSWFGGSCLGSCVKARVCIGLLFRVWGVSRRLELAGESLEMDSGGGDRALRKWLRSMPSGSGVAWLQR